MASQYCTRVQTNSYQLQHEQASLVVPWESRMQEVFSTSKQACLVSDHEQQRHNKCTLDVTIQKGTPQFLPMADKNNKIIKIVHHFSKPIMLMRCPVLQASLCICLQCRNVMKYKVQSSAYYEIWHTTLLTSHTSQLQPKSNSTFACFCYDL